MDIYRIEDFKDDLRVGLVVYIRTLDFYNFLLID